MNAEAQPRRARFSRPERLLPLACLASALALLVSEFMTTFQLASTGAAFCDVQAAGRHHFALGVLAIFSIIAVIVAVVGASKPAAMAVAIAGFLALLLFLIIDLPHAGNSGTLAGCSASTSGQFFEAKANPQAGFWLEMVGALALALSGLALATFTPDQLATLRPRWLALRGSTAASASPTSTAAIPEPNANPVAGRGSESEPPDRPARARGAPPG